MKRSVKAAPVRLRMVSLAFTCSFLVFSSLACVSPPEGLRTMARTEQEDIPVPRDFELRQSSQPDWDIPVDLDKSRSWTGEYAGSGRVGEIAPWYVTEMQKHEWRFRRMEERGPETRVLFFEKGSEEAQILVSRELDSSRGAFVATVRARISPRGPEDFTVDENLRVKDAQNAAVRPASFTAKAEAMEGGEGDADIRRATSREADAAPPPSTSRKGTDRRAQGAKPRGESTKERTLEKHDGEESPSRGGRPGSRDADSLKEIEKFEEASSP